MHSSILLPMKMGSATTLCARHWPTNAKCKAQIYCEGKECCLCSLLDEGGKKCSSSIIVVGVLESRFCIHLILWFRKMNRLFTKQSNQGKNTKVIETFDNEAKNAAS
jgi:hypothetical protein